jgi:hypothetical protein
MARWGTPSVAMGRNPSATLLPPQRPAHGNEGGPYGVTEFLETPEEMAADQEGCNQTSDRHAASSILATGQHHFSVVHIKPFAWRSTTVFNRSAQHGCDPSASIAPELPLIRQFFGVLGDVEREESVVLANDRVPLCQTTCRDALAINHSGSSHQVISGLDKTWGQKHCRSGGAARLTSRLADLPPVLVPAGMTPRRLSM